MIRVEFSRKTHGNEQAMTEAINGLAPAIAASLARHIRRRVEDEGRPAGRVPGYRAVKDGYFVSPKYPVRPPGAKETRGGPVYPSSAAYHAAARVRPGSYSVSGGMWDGLTVQVSAARFARVFFRGRSQGQTARRTKRGAPTGRRESNALKALSVVRSTGLSLLALTEGEFAELASAVEAWIARGVDRALWADAQWSKSMKVDFLERGG